MLAPQHDSSPSMNGHFDMTVISEQLSRTMEYIVSSSLKVIYVEQNWKSNFKCT